MSNDEQWLVQTKQDLTACDTFQEDGEGPLSIITDHDYFDSEAEALKFFYSRRAQLKFAGLAGQYVTYPHKVDG